ncbi:MAG: energy-coupling factor ABC transporter ATP-binding protein, partial [Candidatus Dormibacteraceae bacterium]
MSVTAGVARDIGRLRVEGLTVRYEEAGEPVLRDVAFLLRPGERAMLLGPSGAGKSTLALCCAGLVPRAVPAQVAGLIELDGDDLTAMRAPEVAARIGVVLQDPDAQIVCETVFDEVCFALENLRLAAPEIVARAREALLRVGLADRPDEDPDRLSGGERQRLAIACALAQRPRLIVLDEPTAQLDPLGRRDVYRALADLTAGAGRGLLLVEHDPEPALHLVDRVLVLDREGRLVLDEPPGPAFGAHRSWLEALGVARPRRRAPISPASPARQVVAE